MEMPLVMLKGLILQVLHYLSAIFKIILPGFFPFKISKDIECITHDIGNVINGLEAPILNSATDLLCLLRVDCSILEYITRNLPYYVAVTHVKEVQ
jgi:hypothetical protein